MPMPVSPALPDSHSTHSEHTQPTNTNTIENTDMDIDTKQALSDTEPMNIDTDYITHDPLHDPDETLSRSLSQVHPINSLTLPQHG